MNSASSSRRSSGKSRSSWHSTGYRIGPPSFALRSQPAISRVSTTSHPHSLAELTRGFAAVIFWTALLVTCGSTNESFVSTATPGASATQRLPSPTRSRGPSVYISPGPALWCGVLGSYRASTPSAVGELRVGIASFAPAPGPGPRSIGAAPSRWVCLRVTVTQSQTTPNVLADFTIDAAAQDSWPTTLPAVSRHAVS
jgi:hypothetical protein